jgi:hypothetical protein
VEWADVLIYGVNKLCKYPACYFFDKLTPEIIKADLDKGLPTSCAMKYTGIPGHYISAVGYTDDGKLIMNDPYKDTRTGDANGFNLFYDMADWKRYTKGYGIRFSRRPVVQG